jgi:hypothetical protein
MSEIAEWFAAIVTLATAVVALFIAFVPSIRRWYNKPQFRIEFKNKEPFCRKPYVIENQYVDQGDTRGVMVPKIGKIQHYWIRARIVNVGRSVAKRCKGKLIRIRDAKTMEERKDFDPVELRWVTGGGKPIDLDRDDREYLNIVYTREDDSLHFFIDSTEKEPRAINLLPERKDYILDVVLYGDNVDPMSKSFYLKNSNDFDNIELSYWERTNDHEPEAIKMKKGNRTRFPQKRAILLIGFFLALSIILIALTGVPSPVTLNQPGAELELQANNDFLIFLGTIFLTSLLGIAELLQWLKKGMDSREKKLLALLYLSLLLGLICSLSMILHILRENFSIVNSGVLENGLKSWLVQTTYFDFNSFMQGVGGTILGSIAISILTIIVNLLFSIRYGWWNESDR